MLRVSTIYGYGKYAQITLVTTAVVNPVLDLNVKLVGNTKNVVHLSWKAPSTTSDNKNYLVITKRHRYSFNTIRNITSDTNLNLTLPCGNTYDFTVKAQTKRSTSADSKVSLEIKPSVKAVTNLAVSFIGGEDATSIDWTKEREKGFLLTWNAPPDVKAADIKYYEIIVTNLRTGGLVNHTETGAKATSWTIKRKDHEEDLQPGEKYVFYVRCNALCGFGSSSAQVGLYYSTTRPTQSTTAWTHPSNCRSYEYKCHNGFCIYMWDVCDGSDDCGDNSDEGWFCELLSSSSPSLAPPSAASVTATKSPLYPSPTSYSSSATVTYPSSTKKPFSSSPQSHSSDHIDRPFPYWAVATTAAAGAIIVFSVVYIVLKKCKKDRRTTLKYLQADYPQDMEESISEGDTPMLLENFTDDEILIRA
ncbi:uncharacterized protein [Porites lutea]|uniref:uncharacterized protein isoform X2 n=1 Tax=Porites lutea TaxID=51062 RepID=UPI003CC56145